MKTVGLLASIAATMMVCACDEARTETCGSAVVDPSPKPRWVALEGHRDLTVFVEGANTPMAGRMNEGPVGWTFRPAFPFSAGMRYRVQGERCEASFEIPASPSPAPVVVAIHPTSAVIPENVLRFYVYFSEPMAEGDFLKHVRLEHVESGEDLTGVFFDNIYELWSPDRKRITLLVDPGRVKTGLRANRTLGRAFEAGQTYRLRVLDTWTSLAGRTLRADFTATYRAAPEDRAKVEPARWCLSRPTAGTRESLTVAFHEPVDHVSVGQLLQVASAEGAVLPGAWRLTPDERTAIWTPERVWRAPMDTHHLRVNGRFEDIAGNNINAAMDHRRGELPPGGEDQTFIHVFSAACQANIHP